VDVFWTFAVGLIGAASALLVMAGDQISWRQILVAALVMAWALRLGSYIVGRTVGSEDDPRYAKMVSNWGKAAPRNMAWLLQAQAVAALPLTLAVAVAASRPGGLMMSDAIGAGILVTAILGEGIADKQLAAFRAGAANAGRVCDVGIWAWSRHPNYFFQWMGWLAYPVIAIDPTGSHSIGIVALLAPAAMYWYLVHVSGIPPLEAHMLRSRGDAFRAYQARTSAFFPMPPATKARVVP
jgi:steroid 5-alpha reductase family enzyme